MKKCLSIWIACFTAVAILTFLYLKINDYLKEREIEKHYVKLLQYHKAKNITEARTELKYFTSNNLTSHKNVAAINKEIRIMQLDDVLLRIDRSDMDGRCKIMKELYMLNPYKYEYNRDNDACEEHERRKKIEIAEMEKHKRDVQEQQWKAKYDKPVITKTVGDRVACFLRSDLSDMMKFVVASDRDSFASYVASRKCLILKDGIQVTVLESPGFLGSETLFAYNGMKMWTTRDGIKYHQ